MKSYYDILEVSENASQEVIEKAYKALVKKYHPDIQPRDKIFWAESKIKEITEAYTVLSNPSSRSSYNLKIGVGSDVLKQYNSLYSENQKLKQEVDSLKNQEEDSNLFKNRKKNKKHSEKGVASSILKEINPKQYLKSIGTLLYNETKKPKQERSKDLLALILTIIIVTIIIIVFCKIPVLRNFLFPQL